MNDYVDDLRARIASLQAEVKRLEDDQDMWHKDGMALSDGWEILVDLGVVHDRDHDSFGTCMARVRDIVGILADTNAELQRELDAIVERES